jgi:cytosine/adenosine deaminase-related metal-dependent hydrolase
MCCQVDGRDIRLFDAAGLLTQRSVYAHAVALTDDEFRLMAARGAAIAHCPLSNFFFADMPLRVRRCLDLGVKVWPLTSVVSPTSFRTTFLGKFFSVCFSFGGRGDELQTMALLGAAIAHCPLSNVFFADMPLRVRRCLDLGVKVLLLSLVMSPISIK